MVEGMGSLPQGTVTFLFTDIEGSTRLLERVGRDRYGALLERHRTVLRGAVEASGGAQVEATGDSLLGVFSNVGGAVAAAVAAQRALVAERWPADAEVRVRMGLHTGEAVLGRDGYVGLAVHRGQRVCDAAHGGQILVSSATHAILAADPPEGIGFRDAGEVRLAGFEQPERLSQVVADGLPDTFAEPRAAQPLRDEQPALLERAQELAVVDAAIADAQTGAGRLVVIEGPAGIGKTSLLAEARARAAGSGLAVLYARASELEAAFSFGIVRQLFEATIATATAEEQSRLLGGAAARTARLFSSGGSVEGAEEDVYALLHGLYWLTINLADSRPLALAIDDVQWTDSPSLHWLAYLTRRLDGLPVCVLATSRRVEVEHLLFAELLADPATALLRPKALSAPSVDALVQQGLGADAAHAFSVACHQATGGNPLLLRELLRTLVAEDVAPVAASMAVVQRLAPDAVTRSVRLRLGRLPTEAVRLARAVAVLGDGIEREQAASLAELERPQIAPAAAALARVDLLRPEPPFSFVHPLVRNAVYESIPPQEREAEHARAAELLAQLNAPPEQVAAQLLLAPPESVPRAAELLRDAADRAAAEAGLESAVRYLTRALQEPLEDDERGELLLELAGVETNVGAPSVIAHLRNALALVHEPDRRAEVSLALGHALYWAGEEAEGVDVLERALAEHAELDVELRRRLEAELVVNATRVASQYTRARELLGRLEVSLDEGPGATPWQDVPRQAFWLGRHRLDRRLRQPAKLEDPVCDPLHQAQLALPVTRREEHVVQPASRRCRLERRVETVDLEASDGPGHMGANLGSGAARVSTHARRRRIASSSRGLARTSAPSRAGRRRLGRAGTRSCSAHRPGRTSGTSPRHVGRRARAPRRPAPEALPRASRPSRREIPRTGRDRA